MKPDEFQSLAEQLEKLSPQKKRLAERSREIERKQGVNMLAVSCVADYLVCLRRGHGHAARWGSASRLKRYCCHACRKIFNALTGTLLARLHCFAPHYLANHLGWRRPIKRLHDVPTPRAAPLAALEVSNLQQLTDDAHAQIAYDLFGPQHA